MEFLSSWSPGCPGEGRYQMTTNRRQSAAVISSEEAAHFLLPLWTLMLGFFLLLCGIKGKNAILIFWITGRIWWLFHANGLFVFFLLSSTCLCSLFIFYLGYVLSYAFVRPFCSPPYSFSVSFQKAVTSVGAVKFRQRFFAFCPSLNLGPSTGEPGAVEIQSQDSAPQNLFDSMCMTVDASSPVCQWSLGFCAVLVIPAGLPHWAAPWAFWRRLDLASLAWGIVFACWSQSDAVGFNALLARRCGHL